ncbi:PulJ/GspJ family protein [Dactylosporangium sp. CA-139066]|uniref:PulJ/GspJ family protein n=1 Tax=Dactylosporangium sp. CA-139066 TaxID=3239930 RepID=UPI003D917331
MHVRRDERGLTLIEVLVAIAILGIIAVPLANAVIGFIRNTDDTTRRLNESHDAQIMVAYFAQDVQSVGVRDWAKDGFPLKQSVFPNVDQCGAAGVSKAVVTFAWDDLARSDVVRVSYVVMTRGAERQLHRIRCTASSTSDTVLAHNVDGDPILSCTAPIDCSAAPGVPQRVTLKVTIKADGGQQPFTVTLDGQRRQT